MLLTTKGLGMRRFEIDINDVVTFFARVLMLLIIPTGVEHRFPCIFHRATSLITRLNLLHFEA